jgi:hypothetical protein
MFLFGVVSFNLLHLNDKLKMLKTVKAFHQALISNDKKVIDKSLSDKFVKTGRRIAVGTPEAVYKNDVLNLDWSEVNILVEENYLIPLNILNNSNTSLTFVRKETLITESGRQESHLYYVTYTFDKTADGIKIVRIEEKL